MKCQVCGNNTDNSNLCAKCRSKKECELREQIGKLNFLLDEIETWNRNLVLTPQQYVDLSEGYVDKLNKVQQQLKDLLNPPPQLCLVEEQKPDTPSAAADKKSAADQDKLKTLLKNMYAIGKTEGEQVASSAQQEVPPTGEANENSAAKEKLAALTDALQEPEPLPPPPPLTFGEVLKRLFSDRNIQIMQQIGIFVFVAGVIAYVYSQWTDWSSAKKMGSMLIMTLAFFVGGSLLRKLTSMRWTALSVTILGSLFVPITCLVGVEHDIFPGNQYLYWTITCLISFGINFILSVILREQIFLFLSWGSVYGLIFSIAGAAGAPLPQQLTCGAALTLLMILAKPAVAALDTRFSTLGNAFTRSQTYVIYGVGAMILMLVGSMFASSRLPRAEKFDLWIYVAPVLLLAICGAVLAIRDRRPFMLYFTTVLIPAAYGMWVVDYAIPAGEWVSLLMTMGVGYYLVHGFLKTRGKEKYSAPCLEVGAALIIVTLFASFGAGYLERDYLTILLTLGQLVLLGIGKTWYRPTVLATYLTVSTLFAWIFFFLLYRQVSADIYPGILLLVGFLYWLVGELARSEKYSAIRQPLRYATFCIGSSLGIFILFAVVHYLQRSPMSGAFNYGAAALVAVCYGAANRRWEWLFYFFTVLAGAVFMLMWRYGAQYTVLPVFFGLYASAVSLICRKNSDGENSVAGALFQNGRPDWFAWKTLFRFPAILTGIVFASLSVLSISVVYLLGINWSLQSTNWIFAMHGLLALALYTIINALVLRRRVFEYLTMALTVPMFFILVRTYNLAYMQYACSTIIFIAFILLCGMLRVYLRCRFYTATVFNFTWFLALFMAGVIIINPYSAYKPNALFASFALTSVCGLLAFFSLRRNIIARVYPTAFTWVWSSLLVIAYLYFYHWLNFALLKDLHFTPIALLLMSLAYCFTKVKRAELEAPGRHISQVAIYLSLGVLYLKCVPLSSRSLTTPSLTTLLTIFTAIALCYVVFVSLFKKTYAEYLAIAFGYLAVLTLLFKEGARLAEVGLFALPYLLLLFAVGMLATRWKKISWSQSTFYSGVLLLIAGIILPFFDNSALQKFNLPYLFSNILISAGIICYFSMRGLSLFQGLEALFAYAFSILLCGGHSLVLLWLSTGTPLAGLLFLQVSIVLMAVGWTLKHFKFDLLWKAPCHVAFIATFAAMYLAISRSDLTSMLVFLTCSGLYGLMTLLLRQAFFLWLSSLSFSIAYFFMLRHLQVPPVYYLLWFSILGTMQICFSAAFGKIFKTLSSSMYVIGLFVSFSAMVVMLGLGGKYFNDYIDIGLISAILAALTYFLAARKSKSVWLYYLSAVTALGAYYLALHKYHVTVVEFHTVPLALLIFAAAIIHLKNLLGRKFSDTAFGLACAVLVLPSFIRSMAAYGVSAILLTFFFGFACVLGGMLARRKVIFFSGLTGIVLETLINLYHLITMRELSRGEIMMLVGGAILLFGVAVEFIRNRRLRSKAGAARDVVKKFFSDWE